MAPDNASHQDHPRGCGEHNLRDSHSFLMVGSSPRMQGAQIDKANNKPLKRIIPADAGSTKEQHE